MSRIDLHFANASCAHCVRLVSRSLGELDGIIRVDADRAGARLAVDFDPKRVSIESIRKAMEKSGYPTTLLSQKVIPFPSRPTAHQAA